jgi:16S rRNA (adenine1518-N6/adenine1519-N6)-dimethyltransferase
MPARRHSRASGGGPPGGTLMKAGESASPSLLSQTRALLRARGVRPSRGRGQNFLVDPGVRDRILSAAEVGPTSRVVEIGPGTGILTEAMLRAGAAVLAIEVDRDLVRTLSERLGDHPRFAVAHADALEYDFAAALGEDPARGRIRVVANIPYYITTPLILRLIRRRDLFQALFLTVQREVAERLTASPGGKTYGALTLACRYWAAVRSVFGISRRAFHPIPEVESALVRFDLLDAPRVSVADPDRLFRAIRAAFGVRRKTLRNALCRAGWPPPSVKGALSGAGVDAMRRGETLTLEEFARLSDLLPPLATGGLEATGDEGAGSVGERDGRVRRRRRGGRDA